MCVLGLIYSMRGTLLNTQLTGNVLARQKEVQAGDVGMHGRTADPDHLWRGGTGVECHGATLGGAVCRPAPPAPDLTPGYWANCLGNGNATLRCASIVLQSTAQH